MYYLDFTIIILIPGILLSLYAQLKVNSAFKKASKILSKSGKNATTIAYEILKNNINYRVDIKHTNGFLSDHYNPANKTLNLSDSVYNSSSLAAIGVAAHEAGHAIQDAKKYAPLGFRSAIVPVVQISSSISPIVIAAGFALSFRPLISVGIIFYSLTIIFALITLPVEFDATKRAKSILISNNYIDESELKVVSSVLDAAALTYVASLITSILQLLRLIIISRRYDD